MRAPFFGSVCAAQAAKATALVICACIAIGCSDIVFAGETILYSFKTQNVIGLMADAATPNAEPIVGSDGSYYGTSFQGGANQASTGGAGAIYKLTSAGAESVLYAFGSSSTDGVHPVGSLIEANDGNFYGVTANGGDFGTSSGGYGTIFRISSAGSYSKLRAFGAVPLDGQSPGSGLLLGVDGTLFGVTTGGGDSGQGAIFSITAAGAYKIIHSFSGNDGSTPSGPLALGADGSLYGVTAKGGAYGGGVLFRLDPNLHLGVLRSFGSCAAAATNPAGRVLLGNDGSMYVTSVSGGEFGYGAVMKIQGSRAFIIHFFGDQSKDGTNASGGLIVGSNGTLYGTTSTGGSQNAGTVFAVGTNGGYATLYSFGRPGDGSEPGGGLTRLTTGALIGTTQIGGANGTGTVFSFVDEANTAPADVLREETCSTSTDGGTGGASIRLLDLMVLAAAAFLGQRRYQRFS